MAEPAVEHLMSRRPNRRTSVAALDLGKIEELAANGLTLEQIAFALSIEVRTLYNCTALNLVIPRVAQVIRRRFGINYHVDHIGRLLRSLGWTPQRPTGRALERDEERIQRWIKQQWPGIKKKPGT